MDRRHFLKWSGALASLSACTSLAGCKSEPLAQPDQPFVTPLRPPPPAALLEDPFQAVDKDLAETFERARALGKPTLLFVKDAQKYSPQPNHATLFARFLWDGKDGFWSDLALCELAGASLDEIRAAVPRADIEGESYFVLVEQCDEGRRAELLCVRTPSPFDRGLKMKARRLALELDLSEWRSELHRVVAGDLTVLQRRADDARRALGPAAVADIDAVMHGGETPSDELLAGAPAIFLLDAAMRPESGQPNKLRLEERTRARVIQEGISGAGWARYVSCAEPIRERHGKRLPKQSAGVACGMGSVDEFGAQFLWYYSDESR